MYIKKGYIGKPQLIFFFFHFKDDRNALNAHRSHLDCSYLRQYLDELFGTSGFSHFCI